MSTVMAGKQFAAHGIRIPLQHRQHRWAGAGTAAGGTVAAVHDSGREAMHASRPMSVLLCVGWIGNTDGIGLAGARCRDPGSLLHHGRQVSADERPRPLYAAGDVTGQVMLGVSGATHEGHVAAVNAVTGTHRYQESRAVSWCPQAASPIRNMAQSACASSNAATPASTMRPPVVGCDELTHGAIIDDRTAGFCKLIADRIGPTNSWVRTSSAERARWKPCS